MKNRWKTLSVRVLVGVFILSQAVLLSGCTIFKTKGDAYKVDLEVWVIFDEQQDYGDIVEAWNRTNPFIGQVKFKRFPVDTYKQDLLDALAAGRGPDIFMIRNSWLPSFQDKVAPAPDWMIDQRVYKQNFLDIVSNDFIGEDGKIYAAPLSVDSLALYYNKDLFNAAGIAAPPTTWEAFQEDVMKLTRVDAFGEVQTAGAALGGWDITASRTGNINRATDVLLALMSQKQAFSEKGRLDLGTSAAQGATDFYMQFSSGQSPYYTWNPRQHYSIDAFSEGRAAMMINYSWHYDTLVRKNAKLNVGVAKLPQFSGATGSQVSNFANYWGFAVGKSTPELLSVTGQEKSLRVTDPNKYDEVRLLEAWQFLKFMTFANTGSVTLRSGSTGADKTFTIAIDPADSYLKRTMKPAARRDLADKQKSDPVLGAFADGNLIARSWYQRDPETVEGILNEMLASIAEGTASKNDALRTTQSRLSNYQK